MPRLPVLYKFSPAGKKIEFGASKDDTGRGCYGFYKSKELQVLISIFYGLLMLDTAKTKILSYAGCKSNTNLVGGHGKN